MASTSKGARESRTCRDIKRALLDLLSSKALDDVSMSELAREAQVSRSTLYQHYGNVHEAYVDLVRDFNNDVSPIMSQAACFDGIEPEGTAPFCDLVRSGAYGKVTDTSRFLDTFMKNMGTIGNNEFLHALTSAGYSPEIAEALAVFQMNGCFNAVKKYGADDATWHEVRDAIDTFICGGLDACQEKKRHQLPGQKKPVRA